MQTIEVEFLLELFVQFNKKVSLYVQIKTSYTSYQR